MKKVIKAIQDEMKTAVDRKQWSKVRRLISAAEVAEGLKGKAATNTLARATACSI